MKNRSHPIQIPQIKLLASIMAVLVIAMPCGIAAHAQTINFDVPGGSTAGVGGTSGSYVNYAGQGAYADLPGNTNWNPVTRNGTTSSGFLSDGVTASPITLTATVSGAYSGHPQGAQGTPAALENFYGYGNNNSVHTNTINNVPPGTYNLYLYGKNIEGNRGTTFKVSTDLMPAVSLTTANTTQLTNFIRGDDYVLFKNVVAAAGVITFTYLANSTVYQKYNGATVLSQNAEGDFNGLQLVYVSSNTVPVPSSVTITNLYPNGKYQFQTSGTLSFTANSTNGIDPSGITVALSATMLGGQTVGQTFVTNLTSINGLTITGASSNLTVSIPLFSNALYTATITVVDLDGSVASIDNLSFDTIDPTYDYPFEAEDFNYNSGLYKDNPQTNGYKNLSAVQNIDAFNTSGGPALYRPSTPSGLATELCGDVPLAAYIGTIYTSYDVPNNISGNWGNYTRNYPAGAYGGAYIVYMRASSISGGSDSSSMSVINGTATTASQSPTLLGTFSVPATGGQQAYIWVPLLDGSGNRAVFIGGSVKTLRLTSDNGNYSVNSYLLVPFNTNTVVITNIYPNGATLFQPSSTLSFTVNSTVAANISVSLTGTNLSGIGFATNLTSGHGLTITGTTPSQIISISLASNTVYTAAIQVLDVTGITASTNLLFDTITPFYTFEAEDFDYQSGQFFDPFTNPSEIDGYLGYPATLGVDFNDSVVPEQTDDYSRGGLNTEPCGDVPRLTYLAAGAPDFDVGNNNAGKWGNYTRNYPAGTYNVYMRGASPNGGTDHASLSVVTNGYATPDQTTVLIGKFGVPATGGYQTYTWAPLTDSGGNLVRLVISDPQETLRVTTDSGGYNANFYMLMPADLSQPTIAGIYPNGAYQFQPSGNLSFNASSSAGINASGISVQLTGTNLLGQTFVTNITTANGLIVTGPSTNVSVSLPLASNTVYTAVITVTTANNKTTSSAVSFDTINPAFTFEAEDFNYGGGLFINTPQTNGYADLNVIVGIDTYDSNYNTNNQMSYRTNGLNIDNASDTPRAAYGTGLQDYDVGNNGPGDWANYTRPYPAGVYNIYMRGANGANSNQVDAARMSLVTGDVTTTNQTTTLLGTFTVPGSGWQSYANVPLIDPDGNYAQFVGGSQETLRVTTDGGNYNANYYFLMPADTSLPVNPPKLKASASGANVVVSFLTRMNTTYQLQFKSHLTDANWTALGSTISGNSLIMSSTNAISGSSGFYRLQTIE